MRRFSRTAQPIKSGSGRWIDEDGFGGAIVGGRGEDVAPVRRGDVVGVLLQGKTGGGRGPGDGYGVGRGAGNGERGDGGNFGYHVIETAAAAR